MCPLGSTSPGSSPLSLTAIICLWWSFWSFVVRKKNLTISSENSAKYFVSHDSLIIPDQDCSVCDMELDTGQWRQEGGTEERMATSKTSEYACSLYSSSYYIFFKLHYSSCQYLLLPIIATGLFFCLFGHLIGLIIARVFSVYSNIFYFIFFTWILFFFDCFST